MKNVILRAGEHVFVLVWHLWTTVQNSVFIRQLSSVIFPKTEILKFHQVMLIKIKKKKSHLELGLVTSGRDIVKINFLQHVFPFWSKFLVGHGDLFNQDLQPTKKETNQFGK